MQNRRWHCLKASLSLEAAFSLPFFLLFMSAAASFLVILLLQVNIQAAMEETARNIGKKAYLLEQADKGDAAREETAGLMEAGINAATVKAFLLSVPGLSQKVNRSRIIGGASGLYTHETSYDRESGILDIVISFDYSVPWVPRFFGTLRLVQRMRSHVWVGEPLSEDAEGAGGSSFGTVYVTPTGSVYHLSPDCHYLDLSIRTVSYQQVSSERNADGSRYDPCPDCGAAGSSGQVYITNYGTCYHTSLGCSGLKRTVLEKDAAEVEGMRICTKCREGAKHSH